jgi:very-short-patch-repair endonuclease
MNRMVLRQRFAQGMSANGVLWRALQTGKCGDFTFKCDVRIGRCAVDYLCTTRGVVIFLEEGPLPSRADRARDEELMRAGYSVFRVPAVNVLDDVEGVCEALKAVLEWRLDEFADGPSSSLPRQR